MNVQFLKGGYDSLRSCPMSTELLPLLRFPLRPDFVRELRSRVQVSTGEIQNEWAGDDCHLDYPQVVIGPDELGNVEPEDFGDASDFEPLIDREFPKEGSY